MFSSESTETFKMPPTTNGTKDRARDKTNSSNIAFDTRKCHIPRTALEKKTSNRDQWTEVSQIQRLESAKDTADT